MIEYNMKNRIWTARSLFEITPLCLLWPDPLEYYTRHAVYPHELFLHQFVRINNLAPQKSDKKHYTCNHRRGFLLYIRGKSFKPIANHKDTIKLNWKWLHGTNLLWFINDNVCFSRALFVSFLFYSTH